MISNFIILNGTSRIQLKSFEISFFNSTKLIMFQSQPLFLFASGNIFQWMTKTWKKIGLTTKSTRQFCGLVIFLWHVCSFHLASFAYRKSNIYCSIVSAFWQPQKLWKRENPNRLVQRHLAKRNWKKVTVCRWRISHVICTYFVVFHFDVSPFNGFYRHFLFEIKVNCDLFAHIKRLKPISILWCGVRWISSIK